MQKSNIWSRLGYWFRKSDRANGEGDFGEQQDHGAAELLDVSGDPPTDGVPLGAGRFRLSKSSSALERLEEEYKRIVNLIDAIQEHLSNQGERSEAMVRSLDGVAHRLQDASETTAAQSQFLTEIRDAAAASAASTRRVEEGLLQLPQLADAQRETMVSIGRQLDFSRQTMDRLSSSMDGFQQAIRNLAAVAESSARKLEEIRSDGNERADRVTAALERQTQRLTAFAWSAMAVAGVAAIIALIALWRS